MSRHFITRKTSDTGKKFKEVSELRQVAFDAQKAFAEKYGFQQWRAAYWAGFGGISSCIDFREAPNSKIWGKSAEKGEFYPKKSSKEGKRIFEEIKNLPTVTIDMLNMCIGFDGAPFKNIGYAENNPDYFGFIVGDDWKVVIPDDCEEVIFPKYNETFRA